MYNGSQEKSQVSITQHTTGSINETLFWKTIYIYFLLKNIMSIKQFYSTYFIRKKYIVEVAVWNNTITQ